MDKIYEIAQQKGIDIPDYKKSRIDNMDYKLPDDVLDELSNDDFEKYIEACLCCGSYNAGGYNGWSHGHELLEELGFVKEVVRSGHRAFESMVYKGSSNA